MKALFSLVAVVILILLAWFGSGSAGGAYLFGVILPYAAITLFVLGVIYRVLKWARSPVPFRIPTSCGQQKSLPWIKNSNLDNPHSLVGVVARMALEVLCFRSLFRNTKAAVKDGPRLVYGSDKFLWLGALAFHWSFLIILLRHYRFFTEPVPGFIMGIESLDGLMQIGVPPLLLTNLAVTGALLYLWARRFTNPQVRIISLIADHFPLVLLLGVVTSGVCMRYFFKVDLPAVKQLAMGLISLKPVVPAGIGSIFFIHLFLVSVLLAYFPTSKLMHLAGIFLSPTRNLANSNRRVRHINPWNYPVKVHTYEEYEDEFRDVMKAAGLPVEKE